MKKTISIFFVAFILSVSLKANAQWVQMSNGMGNGYSIYSLAALGNNIFTGTLDSGVFLSTNNGTSWTHTALNNKEVDALAVLGNNIFAGTYLNGVYLTTNNGTNWTQTALNNKSAFSLAVLGNNIFAGTLGSGVYLSTNNGSNWTQTVLNNKSVYSFAVLGNNIFAGTAGSGVYITTNNGTTWTQTALNNKSVNSLAVLGNNIFAGTYSNGIYLSTDNGTSWTQTVLNNRDVWSLTALGNNIFAGTYLYGVYLSTDNGTSWTDKNQGFSFIPDAVFALLIANNYIFAGTNGESVWRRPLSDFTGIKQITELVPASYSLQQNYPNPFNPTTKINFDIAKSGYVTLNVFDALGRQVETLVNRQMNTGSYSVDFNGSNLSGGVYFCRMQSAGFTDVKKLILLK